MEGTGWVKIHRQALSNGWLQNSTLWAVWCYLLLKASHRPTVQAVGFQRVHLEPGQMVFGRDKAAADLHISGSQIRTAINALKSTNNITVKTTNKFSIITVVNWQTYQSDQVSIDQQVDQQTDKQLASKSPTTRHKQEVKELKKETKLSFLDLIPANLRTDGFKTSWDEWLKFRKEIGKPIVETTAKRQLKALGEYSPDIAVSTISLSIEKGWMGLFPEKVNTPSLPATVSKVPPSWLHS